MTASEATHAVVTADGLRLEVRNFLTQQVHKERFRPAVDSWVTGWDEEFSQLLGSLGYLGVTIPIEYGGQGRTYLERFAVTEELLAAGAPIAAHWIADRQIAPALLTHGTEAQKRKYLPRIAAGKCYFAIGMSEPDAGSDLASVRTKAHQVDGGWILNGSKVWTSGAHRAEAFFVLARTESVETAGRHGGLSQFIVDLRAPGVQVRPIHSSSGEHHFNEVFLTDVFVSDEDVLGATGDGWAQVTRELSFERSGPERFLSTFPLFSAAFDDIPVDAADHEAGRYIARYSALHEMSHQVSQLLQAGIPAGTAAAQVKLLGGRFEGDVVGWIDDLAHRTPEPVLSAETSELLDAALVQRPGFTLRGGTTEILSEVIARGLTDPRTRLADSLGVDPDLTGMIGEVMTKAGLRLSSGEPGQRQAAWAQLADLGLVRLTGDPARGGSGAGWAEAAVLLESAAANDVDLPLVEHDLLVGWLADQLSFDAREGRDEITSIAIVGPDGRAHNTAWTPGTELALIVCTDPAGGTRVAYAETDQIKHISRSALRPHYADIRVDLNTLDWIAAPPNIVEELRLRGALARAVQMTGAIGWVVDSAITHVNERRQFGQPLAKFQAVRGLLASMAADAALATAAVAAAVEAAAQGDIGEDPTRTAAVAVAKSCTGHASEIVVRNGHQLHGAIGTTLEHRLHRHSNALLSWRNDYGNASYWDRRLAEDAKTRPHGSLWDVIGSI